MTARGIAAGFVSCAALLAAAPADAQDVVCCNHLIGVKGKWFGALRDCAGTLAKLDAKQRALACEQIDKAGILLTCPAVEPYCPVPCDQAQIDRIKGRIHGLGEAGAAHHKGLNASRLKRGDARDRLWGRGEGLKFEGGSISDFGQAGLDSLMLAGGGATGVGKAYGKAKSAYDDVSGWTQTAWGLGSNPGGLENWSEFGQKLLDMEADAILKQRSSAAIQAMNQHFQKTGNYAGAQNVYRQRWGNYGGLKDFKEKGGKVASGLATLWNLYEKTDKVANDLQDWIDAYKDNKAAEKDIDKVNAEIDRLTELRKKLEAACARKPRASLFREAPYPAYLLLAGPAPADGRFVRVAEQKSGSSAGNDAAVLSSAMRALGRLRAFQSSLRALDKSIGRQVLAPLSPWLARVSREAQPRELLLHLVKESRDEFGRFGKSLDQLANSGEATLKALRSIPPDTGQ